QRVAAQNRRDDKKIIARCSIMVIISDRDALLIDGQFMRRLISSFKERGNQRPRILQFISPVLHDMSAGVGQDKQVILLKRRFGIWNIGWGEIGVLPFGAVKISLKPTKLILHRASRVVTEITSLRKINKCTEDSQHDGQDQHKPHGQAETDAMEERPQPIPKRADQSHLSFSGS